MFYEIFFCQQTKAVISFFSSAYFQKIKSSLYLRYYVKTGNEWRGPISATKRLGNTAAKKRRSGGVVSRRRHSVRFDRPRNRTETYRTKSDVFKHDVNWTVIL